MPRTAICAAPRLPHRPIDLYRIVLVSLCLRNHGVFVRSDSLIRLNLEPAAGTATGAARLLDFIALYRRKEIDKWRRLSYDILLYITLINIDM